MKIFHRFSAVFLALLALGTVCQGQLLTWSSSVEDTNTTNVGSGNTQRPTVASVVFNDAIYIAYTSNNNCSTSTACAIQIKQAAGQSSNGGYYFSSFGFLGVPTIGTVYSIANPAMTVLNGSVYIAWTDQNGVNWLSRSTDMHTWSSPLTITTLPTTEWPTIAVDPSIPNELFLSYMSGTSFTPILCTLYPNTNNLPSTAVTCINETQLNTVNFSPGMVFFDGKLYLAFADRGNSHCLYFYQNTPNTQVFSFWNPLNCGEQTSSTPTPVVYNSDLFFGFRSNDSGRSLDIRVSTDGQTLPYRQKPGYTIYGSVSFLPVQGLISGTLYPSELVAFYVDGSGRLWSGYGR